MSIGNDIVLCPVCEGERGCEECPICEGEGRTFMWIIRQYEEKGLIPVYTTR